MILLQTRSLNSATFCADLPSSSFTSYPSLSSLLPVGGFQTNDMLSIGKLFSPGSLNLLALQPRPPGQAEYEREPIRVRSAATNKIAFTALGQVAVLGSFEGQTHHEMRRQLPRYSGCSYLSGNSQDINLSCIMLFL